MRKIAEFLRLVDADGISITNVACYVSLVKIAATPALSMADISILLIALLNYAHRRQLSSKAEPEAPLTLDTIPFAADLEALKSKVGMLMMNSGVKETKRI